VGSIALVHSPLVGPATWRRVAGALTARGHHVTVPAASAAITVRGWEAFAEAMAGQIDGDIAVLVAHSGAGPLLAHIRERMTPRPDTLVFVDAGLPPATGSAELLPPDLLARLRAIAAGGVLPPWSEWFGPGAMEALVPDEERRSAIARELPRLPVAYFERRVPAAAMPATCGYVLLSEPYADDAAEARRRGWPVVELHGTHLDIVTRPAEVADALGDVLARLSAG
jgi:hypothetical protein